MKSGKHDRIKDIMDSLMKKEGHETSEEEAHESPEEEGAEQKAGLEDEGQMLHGQGKNNFNNKPERPESLDDESESSDMIDGGDEEEQGKPSLFGKHKGQGIHIMIAVGKGKHK